MANGGHKHDVRRQLFRGITRISSHNKSQTQSHQNARDEMKDQLHPPPVQPRQQSNDGSVNAPTKSGNRRSLIKRNNLITPTIPKRSKIAFTPTSTHSTTSPSTSVSSSDLNTLNGSRVYQTWKEIQTQKFIIGWSKG
ncbi:unnamed protein product [Ambrosiozyma monospora]|uniref:Unnamed protein product n=1 Tax=Ambrosiozyma monospora TaxID=43982 RepID=A0ACB5UCM7_AMBMO|nr:unnamed protein product [Ambrosiozyma monospora]